MATNISIFIDNWQWTGSTVPTPQATVDVEIQWTNETGPHTWSGTVRFPNDLADVPVAWVKEELEDLLIRAARKKLRVDE